MADHPDYYSILGVSPDANEQDIRLAFRRLARIYHPDVAETGDLARMRELNAAYQTLSDPDARREYDLGRGIRRRVSTSSPATASPSAESQTQRPTQARAGLLRTSRGPWSRVATFAADQFMPVTALAFARSGAMCSAGLIDGRVLVWDVSSGRMVCTLMFASSARAGVLQEVRLSPSGAMAAAWGFLLGTRVWRIEGAHPVWTTSISGPSGSMDAVLSDAPEQVHLALPDAPLAMADDDPFRWAHEGRHGTAVFTRPLRGPVHPAWAVPRRCAEQPGALRESARSTWRVHQRVLSSDGQRLLTFSTHRTTSGPASGEVHVWDLQHRSVLGGVNPRRMARVVCPLSPSWLPLAVTPDLGWVSLGLLQRSIRLIAPDTRVQRTVNTGPIPQESRAALAPDGAYLALARGTQLDVWRAVDGVHMQQWRFGAEITGLDFATAADRPLFGVGLSNGLVELWS